jgi:hypothetical protein
MLFRYDEVNCGNSVCAIMGVRNFFLADCPTVYDEDNRPRDGFSQRSACQYSPSGGVLQFVPVARVNVIV